MTDAKKVGFDALGVTWPSGHPSAPAEFTQKWVFTYDGVDWTLTEVEP